MEQEVHSTSEQVPGDNRRGFLSATSIAMPNHLKRWWFCLGGTPAYLFVVQIVTGILLAMYYQPAPATAYESIRYITDEATFGWFLRSLHKWAATLMIAAMILHQMRVYFTGAYRRPRELNWDFGMCLLMCALLTGFTGYSLVFEQLSYWGATVAANISDSVPVVGNMAKQLLLGGEEYNERTLSPFYILHAAILPTTIVLLVICHILSQRPSGPTRDSCRHIERKNCRQCHVPALTHDPQPALAVFYHLWWPRLFVACDYAKLRRGQPMPNGHIHSSQHR